MKHNWRITWTFAGLFSLMALPQILHADTIYSNFGPGLTNSSNAVSVAGNDFGGEYYALAFTPSVTVTFTDALTDLVLFAGNNTVDALLLSTNNGIPGASLATLIQTSPITNGIEEFTCTVTCPVLQAGTEYWLQLKELDPGSSIGWYLSSSDMSNGTDEALRYTYYDPNSPIYWPTGPRPVFEIDGTSIVASEPGSLIQLLAGVVVLFCVFYRLTKTASLRVRSGPCHHRRNSSCCQVPVANLLRTFRF